MKKLLLIPLGLGLLAACMPMPMSGPVSHGTSPEVCANVIARANASPDAATKQYALAEAAKMGC